MSVCVTGLLPWSGYSKALANWNLSNGAAMLLLTPLIMALRQCEWDFLTRKREFLGLLLAAVVLSSVAFHSVFEGAAMNFAFLAFPLVIYAAVRFGAPETSAILAVVLATIYVSLAQHARAQSSSETSATIWFVQAFCWVLGATGFLIAGISAERHRAERFALEETGRALEASLREERARLAALRYQINPHFLFNALNSVRAAIPPAESAPREMITDLSSYLRTTLANDDADTIPLQEELRAVSDYLAIEKHRFGDALRVSLDIAAQVKEMAVPIFILQPLVENAIRHGFEASRESFHLQITARAEEARLVIEVANTGVWKAPGTGTGLGLENVRRRLKSLYRDDCAFEHTATDGWVRMKIALPLRNPCPE